MTSSGRNVASAAKGKTPLGWAQDKLNAGMPRVGAHAHTHTHTSSSSSSYQINGKGTKNQKKIYMVFWFRHKRSRVTAKNVGYTLCDNT